MRRKVIHLCSLNWIWLKTKGPLYMSKNTSKLGLEKTNWLGTYTTAWLGMVWLFYLIPKVPLNSTIAVSKLKDSVTSSSLSFLFKGGISWLICLPMHSEAPPVFAMHVTAPTMLCYACYSSWEMCNRKTPKNSCLLIIPQRLRVSTLFWNSTVYRYTQQQKLIQQIIFMYLCIYNNLQQ